MAESKLQRILVASFLIVAIALLCGSIYLHMQQKHHYGRLSHSRHSSAAATAITPVSEGTADALTLSAEHSDSSEEYYVYTDMYTPLNDKTKLDTKRGGEQLTADCMICLCEPRYLDCFISKLYWLEAGGPIIQNGSFELDEQKEYELCRQNLDCKNRTIRSYMSMYARDCDGDGEITCEDFVKIHILGPTGCSREHLSDEIYMRMQLCFEHNNLFI